MCSGHCCMYPNPSDHCTAPLRRCNRSWRLSSPRAIGIRPSVHNGPRMSAESATPETWSSGIRVHTHTKSSLVPALATTPARSFSAALWMHASEAPGPQAAAQPSCVLAGASFMHFVVALLDDAVHPAGHVVTPRTQAGVRSVMRKVIRRIVVPLGHTTNGAKDLTRCSGDMKLALLAASKWYRSLVIKIMLLVPERETSSVQCLRNAKGCTT